MIDDLLPHSSRAPKRGAAKARDREPATPAAPTTGAGSETPTNDEPPIAELTPAAGTVLASTTPTSTTTETTVPPPRRRRRHTREIVFGVALAIVAALAITWWATSSREPKPTLIATPATLSTITPPTNISGGPPASLGPPVSGVTPPAPTAPNPPAGTGVTRTTLVTAYRAMHNVYVASHSYKTISLVTLGHLLPGLTIEDGAASSTNPQVVSLLVPTADRVVLAARDDAGCVWLRDFGSGAQLATQRQVVISCSAAAAPTTGWTNV